MKKKVKAKIAKKSFFEKYLTLDWKEIYLFLILWFLLILLHNLINILFYMNEIVLIFIAMIVVPIFFLIAFFYTVAKYFNKTKK